MVEILQLVHEISGLREVLYKRVDLNSFSQTNTRSSHPEVFCQKMILNILKNSQKNVYAGASFLIKLQAGNLKMSEAATGDLL